MHPCDLDCSSTEGTAERGVWVRHREDHSDRTARVQPVRQIRIKLHPEPRSVHEQLSHLKGSTDLGELAVVAPKARR